MQLEGYSFDLALLEDRSGAEYSFKFETFYVHLHEIDVFDPLPLQKLCERDGLNLFARTFRFDFRIYAAAAGVDIGREGQYRCPWRVGDGSRHDSHMLNFIDAQIFSDDRLQPLLRLDRDYSPAPATTLGRRHGKIAFVRAHINECRPRREKAVQRA